MIENLDQVVLNKKKAEKRILIGGALLILAILGFLVAGQYGVFIGIPLGIAGVVLLVMGTSEFNKISKNFKEEVVGKLVAEFVDNGVFNSHSGLSQAEVYSTEFIKRADRFHTEDYLSGSMEDVNFVSSDVVLEERHVEHTKNGTRTYYETYYKGRVFIFEFNKDFEGFLQVLERGRPLSNRGFKKVKLESVDFNKKFKTYSTSEHSAFYVLTPHFMEALMQFEKNNKGTIQFSFIGNRLCIGINNFRDTFELQMFRKLDDSVFEEFKRDLLVIKEVITELKLNNNIFKKGVL
jgi:hypothetical protein